MSEPTPTPAPQDNSATGEITTEAAITPITEVSANVETTITEAAALPGTEEKSAADKWREDYATKTATIDGKLDQKQHDKVLARLNRFPSMKEALDWAFNADKKISDGSYKKPLSDKATPDEIAEYRKANGIPDDPAGYFEKLPGGLVIGDEDKPIYDALGKFMHGKNAPPAMMHGLVEWYEGFKDEQAGLQAAANAAAKTATEDAMRDEWGADYRPNTNLVSAFISSMPDELQDELFTSTTADGKQIMNNPAMMKWLAQQARDLNYTGSVLPSGGANAKDLSTEISELEKLSGNKQSSYWKGAKTNGETKESARLLELYDIRSRLESRKTG